MIGLLRFEMSKIFKAKLFRILTLIFLLFMIAYYAFVYINTIRVEEIVLEMEDRVHSSQEQLQEMKDAIDVEEGDGDSGMQQELEFFAEFIKKDELGLQAYEKGDWATLLNLEIEEVESDIETHVFNREYYTSSWPTLFTQEIRLEQQKWMRDKEIIPVLPLDLFAWRTIYDVDYPIEGADDDYLKEVVENLSNKYSSTGIYYLNHLLKLLLGVFGITFFLFLFGDIVTKEGLGRNGAINLLRTQPIQKEKIIVSKFITVLVLSALLLLGTAGIALLLGTVFDRIGDWNYPVLVYGEDYAYEFISMSTFLFKSLLLFFMVLLFSYSLLFMFSLLTKRMIIALGLTLATILLGIQLGEEAILMSFAPYIPFHYFATPQIVTMELAATLKNFEFNFTNGVLVLGIYSTILLLITYVLSVLQYKKSRS